MKDSTIPYGYCHCGCGEKTNIAQITARARNWVKGEPIKYVRGHSSRVGRVSDQVIISAYASTGNVWQAADIAGCSGQLVAKRLAYLGVARNNQPLPQHKIRQIEEYYSANRDTMKGEIDTASLAASLGCAEITVHRYARRAGLTNSSRICSTEDREAMGRRTAKYFATHGHPRGALGMKHGAQALAAMSKAARSYWENITPEALDERWRKSLATRKANGTPWPNSPGGGGYKNCKRGQRPDLGEVFFRSSWEANWARYLNFLVANKHDPLQRWEYEPDTFWFEPIRRGTVSYMPDFKLFEKGKEPYYQEVKGRMDQKSRTKLKRMAKYHPEVRVDLIDQKAYREVERKIGPLIPNWEFPRG